MTSSPGDCDGISPGVQRAYGFGVELDPRSVLHKVMAVLHAFRVDERTVTFGELRRRTALSKATLHRTCGDLVSAQLLERVPDGYRLGRHLFELGMRASVERGLVDIATPFMEDLYEVTHETVHLGVREGLEVLYVAKIGGHHQAVAPSRVGGRLPLHVTAIGKALLAHAPSNVLEYYLRQGLARRAPRSITSAAVFRQQIEDIAEQGVSYEFEESAVGLVCVAAPIFGTDGDVVAAISVAGPVTRFSPQANARRVYAAAAGVQTTLARQMSTERR